MRRTAVLAGTLLSTMVAREVKAAPAPRVAIVAHAIGGAEGEFEAKVRAELLAAGFEVLTVFEPTATGPAPLELIAERTESIATVSVVQPPGSLTADVWITDRVTGKVLLRHARPEQESPEAASIIAIRAVELLRASFLELNEDHAPRGAVPPPPKIRQWVAPPAHEPSAAPVPGRPAFSSWTAAFGAAVLGAPGGLRLAAAPTVMIGYRPLPTWTVELQALGPATGVVETPVGTAHFDAELAALRIGFDVLALDKPLAPRLVLGAGAFHFGARGDAAAPFIATSADTWVALALLGAGVHARVTRLLSAVGETDVFFTTPEPVLRFAGQRTARAGGPGIVGTLSLQVAW